MGLEALVVEPGMRVSVHGRVLSKHGRVSIDPPLVRAGVDRRAGSEPPPSPSALAVTIVGVDTDALARRSAELVPGGWVQGIARLSGVWRGDHLEVFGQESSPRPRDVSPPPTGWLQLPCAAPLGGWPAGGELAWPAQVGDYEQAQRRATAVQTTIFRPAGAGPVWVVAAEDLRAARTVLEPVFGARLCVVASRCSADQVQRAESELRASYAQWMAFSSRRTSDQWGQALVTVRVVRVSAGLARWASSQPDGLLDVQAWMTPVAA